MGTYGRGVPPPLRALPTALAVTLPTALVAAGSLVLGFGVADLTGQRWLGGLVLVAALVWCWPRWRRAAGTARAVGLLACYLVAFALSHLIAGLIGAWPSVLLVAVGMALACWAVADRRSAAAAGARLRSGPAAHPDLR